MNDFIAVPLGQLGQLGQGGEPLILAALKEELGAPHCQLALKLRVCHLP